MIISAGLVEGLGEEYVVGEVVTGSVSCVVTPSTGIVVSSSPDNKQQFYHETTKMYKN